MSLRISHQTNIVTSSKSSSNERRKPECQHQQQQQFTSIYIRSRFISARPRSPFRKYEQCIRNSFRQKNYNSNHNHCKDKANIPSVVPVPSTSSIMKQDFDVPEVLQRYRTDLTINLTNFRLQKLTPLSPTPKISVVVSPRAIKEREVEKEEEKVVETNIEVREDTDPDPDPDKKEDDKEIGELQIVEESLEKLIKTNNDDVYDNNKSEDDKILPNENECLKLPLPKERPKKFVEALNDKEPMRRMKINPELLLLKISEMAEKKSKSKSSSSQRLPFDDEGKLSCCTDNKIRSENNFINHKNNNTVNKKQTHQQEHTSFSSSLSAKEKSKSVGELQFFRDSNFLLELINHPILKKQMENSPAFVSSSST